MLEFGGGGFGHHGAPAASRGPSRRAASVRFSDAVERTGEWNGAGPVPLGPGPGRTGGGVVVGDWD